jgi:hypothetical protein
MEREEYYLERFTGTKEELRDILNNYGKRYGTGQYAYAWESYSCKVLLFRKKLSEVDIETERERWNQYLSEHNSGD